MPENKNFKSVAELRGDDVRSAAEKLKQVRKKLTGWNVPDTVHWNQLVDINVDEKNIKINWDIVRIWIKENSKNGIKWSGIGLLWMTEYLTRGLNSVLVDNKILRNTEKIAKENAKTKFIKNHPWLESYLLYYVVVVNMMIAGGQLAINKVNQKSKDKQEPEKEIVKTESEKQEAQDYFGIETTVNTETVKPTDSNFVKKSLDSYWPYLAVMLTELETYRQASVLQIGESRETNGLGLTWHYIYDSNGKLNKYPNTPGKTKKWTIDYNYQQVQRHLIYETLPKLRNAIKNQNNIQAQQAIAIILAGYQRPADMAGIATKISNAKSQQEIADAFQYYPGVQKWKDGTMKRRWWCAAFAVGAITVQDFYDLPRDAFSSIALERVYKDGHFIINEETIQYAMQQAKIFGKSSTVKSFLSGFAEGRKAIDAVQQNKISSQTKTISFNAAVKQIRKKNAKNDLLIYGTEYTVNLT